MSQPEKSRKAIPAPRRGGRIQARPIKKVTVQITSISDERITEILDKLFIVKYKGDTQKILKAITNAAKDPSKGLFSIISGNPVQGVNCVVFDNKDYPNICVKKGSGLMLEKDARRLFDEFIRRLGERKDAAKLKERSHRIGKRVSPSVPSSIGFKRVKTDGFISIPSGSRLPLISSRGDPEIVLGTGKLRTSAFKTLPVTTARLHTQYSEFFFTEEEEIDEEEGVLDDVQKQVEDVKIEAIPRKEPKKARERGNVGQVKKRIVRRTGQVARK